MLIEIGINKAVIDNEVIKIEMTHDELVTHSGGIFTGLPNSVRYFKRSATKEFWHIEDGDDINQVAADLSFCNMIDLVYADIENIKASYDVATQPLYEITLVNGAQAMQGNPFVFNILYHGIIEVGVTKVTLTVAPSVGNVGIAQDVIIDIDSAIETIELLLADAGVWEISSDIISPISVEVL